MMTPSAKNYPHGLKVAVTLILISSLAFPPSKSVGLQLGSRPPGCVNKCMNCRPCVATLVIPPHDPKKNGLRKSSSHQDAHQDDDTYYLLSWKCRCGNKLYQP